ncbi:MAG: hypothetical protein KF753_22495 [Caldilineaceae bacterium]|nr:hypothetical protein [Caldilineaceae bacterium]
MKTARSSKEPGAPLPTASPFSSHSQPSLDVAYQTSVKSQGKTFFDGSPVPKPALSPSPRVYQT